MCVCVRACVVQCKLFAGTLTVVTRVVAVQITTTLNCLNISAPEHNVFSGNITC